MTAPKKFSRGFVKVPRDLIGRVSPSALTVWAALASYANAQGGRCWPSIQTIADESKLSTATVKRSIREIVGTGRLRVEPRPKPGYPNDSNLYHLDFKDRGSPMNPSGGQSMGGEGFTHDLRTRTSKQLEAFEPEVKAPPGRTSEALSDNSKDFQPSADKLKNRDKDKRKNWAAEQFPRLKIICPQLDTGQGCSLLNSMARSYGGRNTVIEALNRLDGKMFEEGTIWGAMHSTCAEVLKGKARGLGSGRRGRGVATVDRFPSQPRGPAPVSEQFRDEPTDPSKF